MLLPLFFLLSVVIVVRGFPVAEIFNQEFGSRFKVCYRFGH